MLGHTGGDPSAQQTRDRECQEKEAACEPYVEHLNKWCGEYRSGEGRYGYTFQGIKKFDQCKEECNDSLDCQAFNYFLKTGKCYTYEGESDDRYGGKCTAENATKPSDGNIYPGGSTLYIKNTCVAPAQKTVPGDCGNNQWLNNGVCTNHTECSDTQVETQAPSKTQDRECQEKEAACEPYVEHLNKWCGEYRSGEGRYGYTSHGIKKFDQCKEECNDSLDCQAFNLSGNRCYTYEGESDDRYAGKCTAKNATKEGQTAFPGGGSDLYIKNAYVKHENMWCGEYRSGVGRYGYTSQGILDYKSMQSRMHKTSKLSGIQPQWEQMLHLRGQVGRQVRRDVHRGERHERRTDCIPRRRVHSVDQKPELQLIISTTPKKKRVSRSRTFAPPPVSSPDGTWGHGEMVGRWTHGNQLWPEETSASCDETLRGYKNSGYRGCQNRTRSGYACQKWTDQSPQGHSRTPPDTGTKVWATTTIVVIRTGNRRFGATRPTRTKGGNFVTPCEQHQSI